MQGDWYPVQFTWSLHKFFYFYLFFILKNWDLKLLFTILNLNHPYQLHQYNILSIAPDRGRICQVTDKSHAVAHIYEIAIKLIFKKLKMPSEQFHFERVSFQTSRIHFSRVKNSRKLLYRGLLNWEWDLPNILYVPIQLSQMNEWQSLNYKWLVA